MQSVQLQTYCRAIERLGLINVFLNNKDFFGTIRIFFAGK